MQASEIAELLHGKRVGKGRWIALCPVHGDRNASLSIAEGKRAVLLRCQSQQCHVRDICRAAGITVRSLWYRQEADPKAIREAEKRREHDQAVRNRWLLLYRHRIADLERWSRIAAALYWHLLRSPHDRQVTAWYEEALDRCLGEPAPWPKHPSYCPFGPQKLLHNIKASHTTPEIARFLKLPR